MVSDKEGTYYGLKFKRHSIYAYSWNVTLPDEQTVNKTDYISGVLYIHDY